MHFTQTPEECEHTLKTNCAKLVTLFIRCPEGLADAEIHACDGWVDFNRDHFICV